MKNEIPNDYFGCCIIFEEENSIVRMVLISVWGNIGGSLNNMKSGQNLTRAASLNIKIKRDHD